MDTSMSPDRPASRSGAVSSKALWGAIGALVLVVAALGGTLLVQHRDGATPTAVVRPQPMNGPEDGTPPAVAAPPVAAAAPGAVPPPSAAAVTAGQTAQGAQPAPGVGVAAAPARAVCAVCGRVESVRTVQHAAPPTGVGAVAGGVLGGVVGNQIGSGSGRTAATVLGAVGGGYAGHTIEKRTRTETRYEVSVRMDDGRLRTVETRTAPPIGKPVTLKGQVLRPADGRT